MELDLNMSVKEAATLIGRSESFVRGAIINGTFPGSYVENGTKKAFHIPRKAVEAYMTTWERSPRNELIDELVKRITEKATEAPVTSSENNRLQSQL